MPSPGDRILHLLKARGPSTAAVLARRLGITSVAVRKHLAALAEARLVDFSEEKGRVGRPERLWALSERAHARFPDSHAFLTLEFIEAARESFGEDGLDRLILGRERSMLGRYRGRLAGKETLQERVAALCRLRTEEGYMAEWRQLPDGNLLLVENHCPICAAARRCQGLCRSELDLFRALLDGQAEIERQDHILAGARRCAYRISPV